MPVVNWARVWLGGLTAGLVMNASEAALHGGMLGAEARALFASYGLRDTAEPWQVGSLVGVTFAVGVTAVWLYAAIRPRYGPGPATALRAGLAVFVLTHLWSGLYLGAGFTGLITPRLAWLPVPWGLVEAPLGTLIGAWLYREQRAPLSTP
jgi:hypothetical protein